MTAAPAILDQLSALTDPVRARLLAVLDGTELSVSELVAITQLPQSTVSRHLRILMDMGWLESRAQGTSRWYRLDDANLEPHARAMWGTVREPLAADHTNRQDARRLDEVLRARRTRSREFFSAAATRWDRLREELYGARAAAPSLAAFLDSAWTVADLGCGTGEMTAVLAPFVHRVIAIDAAPEMLAAARLRLAERDNVEFRPDDLESLSLAPGSLDAAVVSLVLHHVAEPGRVITEAVRALRPGAPLVVVDMVPHDREEYREEMGHLWLGFEADELRRLLVAGGCRADSVRYQVMAQDPRAKGPGLFVAVGRAAV